jgi:hypothetical protein
MSAQMGKKGAGCYFHPLTGVTGNPNASAEHQESPALWVPFLSRHVRRTHFARLQVQCAASSMRYWASLEIRIRHSLPLTVRSRCGVGAIILKISVLPLSMIVLGLVACWRRVSNTVSDKLRIPLRQRIHRGNSQGIRWA